MCVSGSITFNIIKTYYISKLRFGYDDFYISMWGFVRSITVLPLPARFIMYTIKRYLFYPNGFHDIYEEPNKVIVCITYILF